MNLRYPASMLGGAGSALGLLWLMQALVAGSVSPWPHPARVQPT